MSIVRVGLAETRNFAAGWDAIFAAKKTAKKGTKKKATTKKSTGKKKAKR